jgi:hypothetical protein
MRKFAHMMSAAVLVTALPAGAEPDNTIVVTGDRIMTEDVAIEAVRRVARPVNDQLARFEDPVCPRVTGFEERYEAIVAKRIKAVAAEIGAKVGGEGCVANFYVVIVDDGGEFVDEMLKQHPDAFAGISKRELARLSSAGTTARGWSITRTTNSMGATSSQPTESGGTAVKYGTQSVGFGGGANVMRVYDSSNINPSVQQMVGTAWVVLETGATFGKSLTQIADYSAMRGLAMVRPEELGEGDDTILALFEPGVDNAPDKLSPFDRAYLTGLYRAPARRWARSQARYMAEAIARESEQATP